MNGELIVSDLLQNEKLEHSGVKGQKWGVRRWQNEDGTLTPEGRIHYGLKPQYANMTEKEMRDAMARKRTQDDYVRMMTKSANKRKEEVSNFIKTLGDTTSKGIKLTQAGMVAGAEREISDTKKTIDAIKANASSQNRELTKDEKSNLDALNKANQQNNQAIKDIKDNMKLLDKQVVEPVAKSADTVANLATKKQMSDLKSQALQNISEMDEKQLKSVVDRMLLEQQYEDLLNPPKPSKLEKGREIFQTMGALMGIVLTGLGIATALKQLTSKTPIKQSDESDEYLAHYGVKGMKKGDRRWQNEDGSLTPAGYAHYGIDPNKERKQQIKMDRQTKISEAKTQAKVQRIADKQQLKTQKREDKQAIQARKADMAAKRKNVMKVIVGTAAVAGVAAVGYHWLHQKSLDNQMLRDLEVKKQEGKQLLAQLNVEKKAEITMAKAKMMEAKGNVLEKLQSNSGTVIIADGKVNYAVNQAEKGKAIIKNKNSQIWWQKLKQYLS